MKLVVDENIIYAEEAFSDCGKVELVPGREIKREMLIDADALIVRSVTLVNKDLLEGTNVKFVGTATIGEDHIDKEYLKEKGIRFTNAKGSNSEAVAEYVLAAIAEYFHRSNESFKGKTIGIVGVGNIGSKVAKYAEILGMDVVRNDPPLKRLTGRTEYRSLKEALASDVVTFHVPLNRGGADNTVHLLNEENFPFLKKGGMLINTSRGVVVDNTALLKYLKKHNNLFTVLDVWENELEINAELLEIVDIGTPHVAGYSYEGKLNGTVAVYNKLCDFFGLQKNWSPPTKEVENNKIVFDELLTPEQALHYVFRTVYPIKKDSEKTKNTILIDVKNKGKIFDKLRKEYPLRRELSNYLLKGKCPEEILRVWSLSKTLSFNTFKY